MEPSSETSLSLVLSAGGARGLAHIGVIRELEARGYRIDAISGCSMGALVGGFYALGKLEDYARWVSSLERSDILGLLDVTHKPGGFITGERIMDKLHEWIGDVRIEDLPIKYTAVAVDIERERELWITDGRLYDAIRASISIPGVFTPYRYKGRLLVDGSVLNPAPIEPTLDQLTEQTFVVDANASPDRIMSWRKEPDESDPGTGKQGYLRQALTALGLGSRSKASMDEKLDVTTVMVRSLDTMQAAITRQHLAVFDPDRVFRIPRDLCMVHEFHRAEEIIEQGRQLARAQFDTEDPAP